MTNRPDLALCQLATYFSMAAALNDEGHKDYSNCSVVVALE